MNVNFNNISDAFVSNNVALSKIYGQNGLLLWEKNNDSYLTKYLTFEALENGTISFIDYGEYSTTTYYRHDYTISYRKNSGGWNSITVGPSQQLEQWSRYDISVNNGDIVEFKGDNNFYAHYSYGAKFEATKCNIYGNIMSMINSTSFATLDEIPAITGNNEDGLKFAFKSFFSGCNVISTEHLKLPATLLRLACYEEMFKDCENLITPPELPATSLANQCYQKMFYNCKKLITPPELPATSLRILCYAYMFRNCYSLTTSPNIPNASTQDQACQFMFYGCRNLNHISCKIRTISGSNVFKSWVYGVAESGTFIKNPWNNDWPTGTSGIPSGWTIENI